MEKGKGGKIGATVRINKNKKINKIYKNVIPNVTVLLSCALK